MNTPTEKGKTSPSETAKLIEVIKRMIKQANLPVTLTELPGAPTESEEVKGQGIEPPVPCTACQYTCATNF